MSSCADAVFIVLTRLSLILCHLSIFYFLGNKGFIAEFISVRKLCFMLINHTRAAVACIMKIAFLDLSAQFTVSLIMSLYVNSE